MHDEHRPGRALAAAVCAAALAATACTGAGTRSVPAAGGVAPAAAGPAAPPLTLGRGSLDALILPRASRLAHYSSQDTTLRNDDFRRLAPGETVTLVDHQGAGIVRRWWLTIAPRNHTAIQRQLIVRCYWDGETEPSVEVPVSDFFGVGFGEWVDFVSLPLNMTSGGYNSYWAMPFQRSARITVENRSPVIVDRLYYNVAVEAYDRLPDSTLYFHAQFRRARAVRGEPIRILAAEGRGHYVGTLLSMAPPRGRSLWYLEGNERLFVDGERAPSIVGTGTEDYFSSGWYFDTGPYSAPYHGATIKDTLTGRISTYRWHIEDPIPFRRGLEFTIEHGGTNDTPGTDYTSVAFWYQTHPHAPFPPLPAELMPIAQEPPDTIPGMVEAEAALARARVTAGAVRLQEMSEWEVDSARWSGGTHLWWVEGRQGARLTMPLRAPRAGSFELVGYFTRATNYGDVQVSVNGRRLSPIVRGYAPTVQPTGPISFGRVPLRRGANEVVLEIVGKDPRSQGYSEGYLVGVDGFVLR